MKIKPSVFARYLESEERQPQKNLHCSGNSVQETGLHSSPGGDLTQVLAFHLEQGESTASVKCGEATLRHLFFHSVKTMQASAQKPQEYLTSGEGDRSAAVKPSQARVQASTSEAVNTHGPNQLSDSQFSRGV